MPANLLPRMTAKEKRKTLVSIVASIAAVMILSVILDDGISRIPDALPFMDKSAAGFFLMSLLSSFPEYLVTAKFFSSGQVTEGVSNIAHSNAINIMLANLAMGASFMTGGLDKDCHLVRQSNALLEGKLLAISFHRGDALE